MAVGKGPHLAERDYFIDYPIEEVMFRWDHEAGVAYRRFYGEAGLAAVEQADRLWNEALAYGDEVDERAFRTGKPRA